MGSFKKSSSITGKIKGVVVHEGTLMYEESGEICNFIEMLTKAYGEDTVIDISTSQKTDEDIDI